VGLKLTVIGSIFFTRDQGLWMEKRSISARFDFVDYTGFEVNVERPRDMLSGARLREEGGEATVVSRRRILSQATIGLERNISKTR
jgi:hypothetical protein